MVTVEEVEPATEAPSAAPSAPSAAPHAEPQRKGPGKSALAVRPKTAREFSVREWEEMEKLQKIDVGAIAVNTVKSFATNRPILVSFWVFGLLLAAFAGGAPVDEASAEAYSAMLQRAEVVDSRELGRSTEELYKLEEQYYSARGWFGACDANCSTAFDKVRMAEAEVARTTKRRDEALSEARREVSIWSSYGVQDVRKSFWAAWKSGQDFASRMTMYDALFLAAGRDETAVSLILKLVFQYVINLSLGLIGAFFYFLSNVYSLVVSYGASVLSGLAFFLLAAVAGCSLVAAYLGTMYGVVAGGGVMLLQHAAKQAALEGAREMRAVDNGPRKRVNPSCPV